MTTSHPSVKPKQRFRPNIETLEPRCTPFAAAVQVGNTILIAADPAVGGTIDIFDNGTSNAGAITVFSAGIPVPVVGAAGFKPGNPISVVIFGSNKNDTVSYNLIGNLISLEDTSRVGPFNSAGRIITADLGKGNMDTFQFNWPAIPATAGGWPPLVSGAISRATFQLNVADHAKTENLSANLNVAALIADVSVGLTGDSGVDNLAVHENILDFSTIPGILPPLPPGSGMLALVNKTVVNGSNAQKGSRLLDLPAVTWPGGGFEGVNSHYVFGNEINTTATVPKGPTDGGPPNIAVPLRMFVFGVPRKNIIFV
jgi:hypothetical protein